MQPGLGEGQLTVHGGRGNFQSLGCFVVGELAKEQQFNQVAFSAVLRGQPLHRFIQFNDAAIGLRADGWLKVQGIFTILDDPNGVGTTAALGLNNKGQVVGSYSDTSGPAGNSHGFVYTISTKSFETVDDPSGVGMTVVNGINDNGMLVGFWGTNPKNYGFVATPETP